MDTPIHINRLSEIRARKPNTKWNYLERAYAVGAGKFIFDGRTRVVNRNSSIDDLKRRFHERNTVPAIITNLEKVVYLTLVNPKRGRTSPWSTVAVGIVNFHKESPDAITVDFTGDFTNWSKNPDFKFTLHNVKAIVDEYVTAKQKSKTDIYKAINAVNRQLTTLESDFRIGNIKVTKDDRIHLDFIARAPEVVENDSTDNS